MLSNHSCLHTIFGKSTMPMTWGTPKQITNTLQNYYDKQEIVATIMPTDTMLLIYPTRGTAQGNVLSPMLCNCIVNCVGDIMDNLNIGSCVFADDIVVAMRGNDINHTHAIIQRTLNQLSIWVNEEGLRFNIPCYLSRIKTFHYLL